MEYKTDGYKRASTICYGGVAANLEFQVVHNYAKTGFISDCHFIVNYAIMKRAFDDDESNGKHSSKRRRRNSTTRAKAVITRQRQLDADVFTNDEILATIFYMGITSSDLDVQLTVRHLGQMNKQLRRVWHHVLRLTVGRAHDSRLRDLLAAKPIRCDPPFAQHQRTIEEQEMYAKQCEEHYIKWSPFPEFEHRFARLIIIEWIRQTNTTPRVSHTGDDDPDNEFMRLCGHYGSEMYKQPVAFILQAIYYHEWRGAIQCIMDLLEPATVCGLMALIYFHSTPEYTYTLIWDIHTALAIHLKMHEESKLSRALSSMDPGIEYLWS
jgi:hypothetical protein